MNKSWKKHLYSVLFPNRCPGCDTILHPDELVCERCGERMILEHDAVCRTCGKVACVCKTQRFHYDKAFAACRYADETVSAIVRMKLSQNTNFAYFSARILAERIRHSVNLGEPDCVMPVPMHPSKERRRGYNQAALIAQEVGALLSLPCRNDVLFKRKSKTEQHHLNAAQRRENAESFGIRDIPLDGIQVLLCDDVLTTGSTLSYCAALLKQNGASAVIAAAAATTVPVIAPRIKEESP